MRVALATLKFIVLSSILYLPMSTISINKGLEGIYLDESKISSVDGEKGILIIRGYKLEEFAGKVSYEEVLYLLLHDDFPNETELVKFKSELISARRLPEITIDLLKSAANQNLDPMNALRIGVSSLGLELGENNTDNLMIQIASTPLLLATYMRLLEGKEVIKQKEELDHVSNFLYMIEGREPDKARVRALSTYFNTVSDHGLNASTFVARTIMSTDSDVNSAITGAIGALKGPKHGGAPGPALDMILEIEDISHAEPYLRQKLDDGERIMGFGHRVYKTRDPRAEVLSQAAKEFFTGERKEFYQFVIEVEKIVVNLLEEYKPGRKLFTNVEFYTALILHGIGFTPKVFSSLFTLGRIGGWSAHIIEQTSNNRLIRPRLLYSGPKDRILQ